MGFRTVVMLNNDMTHEWSNDPDLGKRIMRSSHRDTAMLNYGKVVECVHADCQTLAILDGYTAFKHIDSQPWARGASDDEAAIRLLKSAANKLGYRLVKQPAK